MSNVQLSLSLERLAARRTFPLQKRTSVCRNLFGPVDHDELQREMNSKLQEISERDQERWNFNFEDSSPLDGLYEWQEVSAEETPLFYQDSVRGHRTVPDTPVRRRPVEDSPSVMDRLAAPEAPRLAAPEAPSSPCLPQLNQENRKDKMNSGRTSRAQAGVKRRRSADNNNTHITDFFVKRKRPVDRTELSSCLQSSKSPIPVEQTPRKRIR